MWKYWGRTFGGVADVEILIEALRGTGYKYFLGFYKVV
jgi:hypothetical protein